MKNETEKIWFNFISDLKAIEAANLEHVQPSAFSECSAFSIPRIHVFERLNIKNRHCLFTAFSAPPQPSPTQSFTPCCHHKDKHTHPLCLSFPSPCPVPPHPRPNVWLWVGMNTLQKTGLVLSGEWAMWSGRLLDPARCRRQTGHAH